MVAVVLLALFHPSTVKVQRLILYDHKNSYHNNNFLAGGCGRCRRPDSLGRKNKVLLKFLGVSLVEYF